MRQAQKLNHPGGPMKQAPQRQLHLVMDLPRETANTLRPVEVYFVVHEDDDLCSDLARLVDVVRHIGIEPEIVSLTDIDPLPVLLAATRELPCAIVLLRTANLGSDLVDRMRRQFQRQRYERARLHVAELGPSYATIVDSLERTVRELRAPWRSHGPRELFIGNVSEIQAELSRRGTVVPATLAPAHLPELTRGGHRGRKRTWWPAAAIRALKSHLC